MVDGFVKPGLRSHCNQSAQAQVTDPNVLMCLNNVFVMAEARFNALTE